MFRVTQACLLYGTSSIAVSLCLVQVKSVNIPDTNSVVELYVNDCSGKEIYREARLDFTPEMEVFYKLLERCHVKNKKMSIKEMSYQK